jgi:hypothetical protein
MGVAVGLGLTDDKVYDSMFTITSGVTAVIATSLFSESLALSHKNPKNRRILASKEVDLSKSYRILPIGKTIRLLVQRVLLLAQAFVVG